MFPLEIKVGGDSSISKSVLGNTTFLNIIRDSLFRGNPFRKQNVMGFPLLGQCNRIYSVYVNSYKTKAVTPCIQYVSLVASLSTKLLLQWWPMLRVAGVAVLIINNLGEWFQFSWPKSWAHIRNPQLRT